jgi:hypothetical protein
VRIETDYRSVVITPSRAFADRMCACQDRMDADDEMRKVRVTVMDACLIEVEEREIAIVGWRPVC